MGCFPRQFPFDEIKIDRCLVRLIVEGREATAIINAIVSLADALSMETTVEGAERPEQVVPLQQQGCSIQGFHYSRPLTEQDALAFLMTAPGQRPDLPRALRTAAKEQVCGLAGPEESFTSTTRCCLVQAR